MAIQLKDLQVKIDGKDLPDCKYLDFKLTQELLKPNEFTFSIKRDKIFSDSSFAFCKSLLGKSVRCSFTAWRKIGDKSYSEPFLFDGIIIKADSSNDNLGGNIIDVLAYSPDYLLKDNRNCFSYEDETLEGIVSDVVNVYPDKIKDPIISPRSSQNASYIVQYNETRYDFLVRLAKRYGEWFYYSGENLVFGKLQVRNEKALTLYFPKHNVTNYQHSVMLDHFRSGKVEYSYLDNISYYNTPNDYSGKELHALTDMAYTESLSIYKDSNTITETYAQESEAKSDILNIYLEIEGMSRKANLLVCKVISDYASLRIGNKIQISEYNRDTKTFEEQEDMLIFQIVHTFTSAGEYKNEFLSIPAKCEYPPYPTEDDPYPIAKALRAKVIDNKDPEKLGRVRVQFHWQAMYENTTMCSPWIRMVQPHGGNNKGFYFIPEIGEDVMVDFEMGDPERPYVIGTLYHGQQKPDDKWYSDSDDVKAIRTRNGHTVEIHDEGEGGYIRIYDNEKENYILTFSTDDKLIKLESTGNIELHAENDIILKAANNVNITAENKNITCDAGENITETAKKNISVKADENISIDAGNDMDREVGNDDTIAIQGNQIVNIENDKNETIGKKYQLKAENMVEDITETMRIQSRTHEQKATSKMTLDGGPGLDMSAQNVKIN